MEETIQKVINTINSCETLEHLMHAQKFMSLYLKRFDSVIEYYNNYDDLMKIVNVKRSEITLNGERESR